MPYRLVEPTPFMSHKNVVVSFDYEHYEEDVLKYRYTVENPATRALTQFDVRDLPWPSFADGVNVNQAGRGYHYWAIRLAIDSGLLTTAGIVAGPVVLAEAARMCQELTLMPADFMVHYDLAVDLARCIPQHVVDNYGLDDLVHYAFSNLGTNSNNAGPTGQLRTLLEQFGVNETCRLLTEQLNVDFAQVPPAETA